MRPASREQNAAEGRVLPHAATRCHTLPHAATRCHTLPRALVNGSIGAALERLAGKEFSYRMLDQVPEVGGIIHVIDEIAFPRALKNPAKRPPLQKMRGNIRTRALHLPIDAQRIIS
jgi:hypothetical protein